MELLPKTGGFGELAGTIDKPSGSTAGMRVKRVFRFGDYTQALSFTFQLPLDVDVDKCFMDVAVFSNSPASMVGSKSGYVGKGLYITARDYNSASSGLWFSAYLNASRQVMIVDPNGTYAFRCGVTVIEYENDIQQFIGSVGGGGSGSSSTDDTFVFSEIKDPTKAFLVAGGGNGVSGTVRIDRYDDYPILSWQTNSGPSSMAITSSKTGRVLHPSNSSAGYCSLIEFK